MYMIDYRDHTGSSAEKFFKSTLFQSSHLLLGLNCLEPGQTQATHTHAVQDKFYFVKGWCGFLLRHRSRAAR